MRDHLIADLGKVDVGLTFLKSEYVVLNPDGASGRIDILARDPFGHIVCIELKRSDQSARATLNELSKYITLLVARDRVPREMIRCVVVSTHWHELLLPLSYLAASTGVDITALRAFAQDGELAVEPVELKALRFLPQLAPDFDRIWFREKEPRTRFIDLTRARSASMPFVRLALLKFAASAPVPVDRDPFALVVCVWRLRQEEHAQVEAVTGKPIGTDFPYFAPGWEAEADAKDWIADACHPDVPEVCQGWGHATSESLRASFSDYRLEGVERIGDWPRLEFINDDDAILEQVLAGSPVRGSQRQDRYTFTDTLTPKVRSSWDRGTRAFLDFSAFEPAWSAPLRAFIATLDGKDIAVRLEARDLRHLMYALWQAHTRPNLISSYAGVVVDQGGPRSSGIRCGYSWDGETCPLDPETALAAVYETASNAAHAFGSAVDEKRYELALELHGFRPFVATLEDGEWVAPASAFPIRSINDFAQANPAYVEALAKIMAKHMTILGPITH